MKAVRTAIVLALIGVLFCLWLFVTVKWYNFIAFMLIAQPLLLLAVVVFVGVALRESKSKGVP